jgi:hypothetical protein
VSKYVEFPLGGGGSIVIEAKDEPARTATGFLRAEDARPAPNTAAQSFDASVEGVRRSAELLVSKLRGLSSVPDEMTISFALSASGELGGLTVSKGGNDANFNVMLKWQREDSKANDEKDEKEEG